MDTSEAIAKGQLHLPGITGAGDLAEAGAAECRVGVAEVDSVESVECLDAHIDGFAFGHSKSFHQTQVHIEESGSDGNVPLRVARRIQSLNLKRIDVQKMQAVFFGIEASVRIADAVGSQRTSITLKNV